MFKNKIATVKSFVEDNKTELIALGAVTATHLAISVVLVKLTKDSDAPIVIAD